MRGATGTSMQLHYLKKRKKHSPRKGWTRILRALRKFRSIKKVSEELNIPEEKIYNALSHH